MANTALVPVFTGTLQSQSVQLCDARTLHQFMAVLRDFSNWIKGRIRKFGFAEGVDYLIVSNLSSPDLASSKSRAQTQTDYHLTLDMAKELAMVENNEQGRAARRYFIECERGALLAAPLLPQALSAAQAGEVFQRLAERFPNGADRPYAWSRFNNHFRLASYKDLQASRYEEALTYIARIPERMPAALPALPAPAAPEPVTTAHPLAAAPLLALQRFIVSFDAAGRQTVTPYRLDWAEAAQQLGGKDCEITHQDLAGLTMAATDRLFNVSAAAYESPVQSLVNQIRRREFSTSDVHAIAVAANLALLSRTSEIHTKGGAT